MEIRSEISISPADLAVWKDPVWIDEEGRTWVFSLKDAIRDLFALKGMEDRIMTALDELRSSITAQNTAVAQAISKLTQLKDQVSQANLDQQQLVALATEIQTTTQQLLEALG